jgi:hypothetical protein
MASGHGHRVPVGESSGIAAPARDPEISVWIQQVLLQKAASHLLQPAVVTFRSDVTRRLSSCLGARPVRITPNM